MNIYFALLCMLFNLVVGLVIGMRWGVSRFIAAMMRHYNLVGSLAVEIVENSLGTLSVNKFLLGQIRGFKKAGGDLLSLTIKSLDSIDKDKLRTIRSFRSLLTWAEKYVAVSK